MKMLLVLILLSLTSPAFAAEDLQMCIHAHYMRGLGLKENATSGHASITIEKEGQRIHSWGYWPDGLATNGESDGDVPLSSREVYVGYYKKISPEKQPEFLMTKRCKKINEADIERARSLAEGYKNQKGDWTPTNNCVSFAGYVYTRVTKEVLPIPPVPQLLYGTINALNYNDANENSNAADVLQAKQTVNQ